MTEIQTDLTADNQARNIVADKIREIGFNAYSMGSEADPERLAAGLVGSHVVTFEREVNEHGVPVRRYVMRGDWEVDPQPPVHLPRAGDVVCFAEHEDGEIETIHHGKIPPGQEWIVQGVLFARRSNPEWAHLLLRLADWHERQYIAASSDQVVIIRRPK